MPESQRKTKCETFIDDHKAELIEIYKKRNPTTPLPDPSIRQNLIKHCKQKQFPTPDDYYRDFLAQPLPKKEIPEGSEQIMAEESNWKPKGQALLESQVKTWKCILDKNPNLDDIAEIRSLFAQCSSKTSRERMAKKGLSEAEMTNIERKKQIQKANKDKQKKCVQSSPDIQSIISEARSKIKSATKTCTL